MLQKIFFPLPYLSTYEDKSSFNVKVFVEFSLTKSSQLAPNLYLGPPLITIQSINIGNIPEPSSDKATWRTFARLRIAFVHVGNPKTLWKVAVAFQLLRRTN